MTQVYSILYEDSQPARRRISYYNSLAVNAGFSIRWMPLAASANGNSYAQLQDGEADALLISGREDFRELSEKDFRVLISKRHERRMVALFSPSIDPLYFSKQYSNNILLTIAADFEWQAQMAANFLSRALPLRNTDYQFLGIGDDHVFDARVSALFDGRIDIAIFPLDDLNMSNNASLRDLKHMVLPLFDCPPNIYQATTGLIIRNKNAPVTKAMASAQSVPEMRALEALDPEQSVLNALAPEEQVSKTSFATTAITDATDPKGPKAGTNFQNTLFEDFHRLASDDESMESYLEEAALLIENSPKSCGVFSMKVSSKSFTYLAFPEKNRTVEIWKMSADLPSDKLLFSTTDYMKDFFRYEYLKDELLPDKPVCFIASHKSIHSESLIIQMAGRRVWAAGNKTWLELAKKGIWVEGSADGLGLESLASTWAGYFTGIDKADVNILTNDDSAKQWTTDGWSATATYKLISSITPEIIEGLKSADVIFWTSYQQYQACRAFVRPDVLHASPAGKTSVLLKKDGIEKLVVFPSIKAFSWYREQGGC